MEVTTSQRVEQARLALHEKLVMAVMPDRAQRMLAAAGQVQNPDKQGQSGKGEGTEVQPAAKPEALPADTIAAQMETAAVLHMADHSPAPAQEKGEMSEQVRAEVRAVADDCYCQEQRVKWLDGEQAALERKVAERKASYDTIFAAYCQLQVLGKEPDRKEVNNALKALENAEEHLKNWQDRYHPDAERRQLRELQLRLRNLFPYLP